MQGIPLDGSRPIVLFGLGATFDLSFPYFRDHGIPVHLLCDNDSSKQNHTYQGIPVISPARLRELSQPVVLTFLNIPEAERQVSAQLDAFQDIGLSHVSFYRYILASHAAEIGQVMKYLQDDVSRDIYARVVRERYNLSHEFPEDLYQPEQYFALAPFSYVWNGEIFVDIGACCGDTVEQFLFQRFGECKKIYCFEPGARQFRALNARMRRLREEWGMSKESLVCVQAALGDQKGTMLLQSKGLIAGMLLSSAESNQEMAEVPVETLDDYLNGMPATFLKIDVEGYEASVLRGARKTIQKYCPKLAVSVYHRPYDLYELPLLIHDFYPEYHMAIRHHSRHLSESVLYCW